MEMRFLCVQSWLVESGPLEWGTISKIHRTAGSPYHSNLQYSICTVLLIQHDHTAWWHKSWLIPQHQLPNLSSHTWFTTSADTRVPFPHKLHVFSPSVQISETEKLLEIKPTGRRVWWRRRMRNTYDTLQWSTRISTVNWRSQINLQDYKGLSWNDVWKKKMQLVHFSFNDHQKPGTEDVRINCVRDLVLTCYYRTSTEYSDGYSIKQVTV